MSADGVPSTSRHAMTAALIGMGSLAAAVLVRSGGFQTSAPLSAEGHRAVLLGHLDCAGGTHYVITVDVEQDGELATGRSQ